MNLKEKIQFGIAVIICWLMFISLWRDIYDAYLEETALERMIYSKRK